ncbi:hypothetical protein PEPS_32460 (plasmid) [Persicobacter psychrovividus]|uniref:Uncharacterized protein n=1 Tax=Persicobacter psychrovividus TaxID=387638 RepID=A0ABN6LDG2_9BACT|nr:hypothetical protein PEPS_32460 [Persicobacter psychrovividus]
MLNLEVLEVDFASFKIKGLLQAQNCVIVNSHGTTIVGRPPDDFLILGLLN